MKRSLHEAKMCGYLVSMALFYVFESILIFSVFGFMTQGFLESRQYFTKRYKLVYCGHQVAAVKNGGTREFDDSYCTKEALESIRLVHQSQETKVDSTKPNIYFELDLL